MAKPELKIQGCLSQIYIPGVTRRIQVDESKLIEIKQKQ